MKFNYLITDEQCKQEQKSAMSLKKLVKTLDPKKTYQVEYKNKKKNNIVRMINNGKI